MAFPRGHLACIALAAATGPQTTLAGVGLLGSTAKLTVPSASAFPAGGHLRYRVRAYDGTDYGSWSGCTTFVMNTGLPAAPAVTGDTYEQNGWTAKADSAVPCALDTSSTDGAGYHWGLDNSSLPSRSWTRSTATAAMH
ncbi:hypothetical protein ACFRCI_19650 [Streptomyces sp. NPDC056638]|uniref:hypothetical protein n=1 Tax=Streptomyces sp. NPDC056638 TaxID=3345887 RepID=UPI003697BB72